MKGGWQPDPEELNHSENFNILDELMFFLAKRDISIVAMDCPGLVFMTSSMNHIKSSVKDYNNDQPKSVDKEIKQVPSVIEQSPASTSTSVDDKMVCHICRYIFSTVRAKNAHLKNIHHEPVVPKQSVHHIKCPFCIEEGSEKKRIAFSTRKQLNDHLKQKHSIPLKTFNLFFKNMEEFEAWRAVENRNVDYALVTNSKPPNGSTVKTYTCNRNNYSGYTSHCSKRAPKAGGSIKMEGTCPAYFSAVINKDGVFVKYIEQHVGHSDESRSKRLTTNQQQMIADQLRAGVTKEKVLEDARVTTSGKVERINILSRADLSYITRKFNIDKRKNDDDMMATALKVKELNSQGNNSVFVFKQIGEAYPGLKAEDFALGYMNENMERKLKQFKLIIYVYGTHGKNRKNYDITVLLIKDENNIGFPAAFFISNRLDQSIQEVFLKALKNKVGEPIDATYIMTDDDVKYYNAWCQVMVTDKKPRRLLCTWHVIKDWSIQGQNKLKKIENKKNMEKRMRNILREKNEILFNEEKEEYFYQLEVEQENAFLEYLQSNYFQSKERIRMWAHCYRKNAGINNDMAIESFNKFLNYIKMQGKQNIRVEKLLDTLEKLANEKMWEKIILNERRTTNNYQVKENMEAHIKVEDGLVEQAVFVESSQETAFDDEEYNFYIEEFSTSESDYKMDVQNFMEENNPTSNVSTISSRKILEERILKLMPLMSDDTLRSICETMDEALNSTNVCNNRKRKIEKQ